jgi:hypothetical protein
MMFAEPSEKSVELTRSRRSTDNGRIESVSSPDVCGTISNLQVEQEQVEQNDEIDVAKNGNLDRSVGKDLEVKKKEVKVCFERFWCVEITPSWFTRGIREEGYLF